MVSNKYAFDIDKYMESAAKGIVLDEMAIKVICAKAREVLSHDENVIAVQSPVTIVGDIHG
jgi:serine/threonine-protein phosphatase PPG1